MQAPVEAFHLPAGAGRSGQRFCVLHRAHGPARGAVLHLHAFAEEMNKSRRMVALQSRALAEAGFTVLNIDLLGCGDSSGDFGDATWDDWLADGRLGAEWLMKQHPGPLWLWGLRTGALLATQLARQLGDRECNLLLWQPPSKGKPMLQQFLRLKAARDLLSGEGKGVTEALRSSLAAGAPVEIAGYQLSPALAAGLESAALLPRPRPGRACWFEVGQALGGASPATTLSADAWRKAGWTVELKAVTGPPFWQTTEIETAPELLRATCEALSGQAIELVAA